jgi:hypothetical protein
MDRLDEFRTLIRSILTEHARIPFAVGKLTCETVFDRESDRYVVLVLGEDHAERTVHFALIHIDIIDGKIWVQHDGTEYGVAQELIDAGVPEDRIVLGFLPPYMRPQSEGAAA